MEDCMRIGNSWTFQQRLASPDEIQECVRDLKTYHGVLVREEEVAKASGLLSRGIVFTINLAIVAGLIAGGVLLLSTNVHLGAGLLAGAYLMAWMLLIAGMRVHDGIYHYPRLNELNQEALDKQEILDIEAWAQQGGQGSKSRRFADRLYVSQHSTAVIQAIADVTLMDWVQAHRTPVKNSRQRV